MRISCNWLRELVEIPQTIDAKSLAHKLSMSGLEAEGCEQVISGIVGHDGALIDKNMLDAGSQNDTILTLNVTPNRPDALCHVGVAREIAALLDSKLKASQRLSENGQKYNSVVKVEIKDTSICRRYACAVLSDICIAPSPQWLQSRLLLLGIRPINNVVDVTNYVMLEKGQPLHAFDYSSLSFAHSPQIIVRNAKPQETLTTLDGVKRALLPSDLVIADEKNALALAGVMGGQGSEVQAQTQKILLESAYFDPSTIRRTSKKHNLSTEASYRFERGCDPNGVMDALSRAVQLLQEICGAQVDSLTDCYEAPVQALEVAVSAKKVAQVSGMDPKALPANKIEQILTGLGLQKISSQQDEMLFRVPSFRPDLTRPIDLVEEVLRINGYEQIPSFSAAAIADPGTSINSNDLCEKIRQTLVHGGFREAINLAFGAPEKMSAILPYAEKCVQLINPLGVDMSVLRQSLLPRLLENAAFNIRQNCHDLRYFECGTIFIPKNDKPSSYYGSKTSFAESWADERSHVAVLLAGSYGFSGYKTVPHAAEFYDIKGVALQLLSDLGCAIDPLSVEEYSSSAAQLSPFLHPRSAYKIAAQNSAGATISGYAGELHPDLLELFGLSKSPLLLELDISDALKKGVAKKLFQPIAKFPGIDRDIAFVVDEKISAGSMLSFMATVPELKKHLKNIKVFDEYQGKGLPEGKKSLAFALFFQDAQRTMIDDEVLLMMQALLIAVQEKFSATIR